MAEVDKPAEPRGPRRPLAPRRRDRAPPRRRPRLPPRPQGAPRLPRRLLDALATRLAAAGHPVRWDAPLRRPPPPLHRRPGRQPPGAHRGMTARPAEDRLVAPLPRHGPQQRLGQRPPARRLRGPRRRRPSPPRAPASSPRCAGRSTTSTPSTSTTSTRSRRPAAASPSSSPPTPTSPSPPRSAPPRPPPTAASSPSATASPPAGLDRRVDVDRGDEGIDPRAHRRAPRPPLPAPDPPPRPGPRHARRHRRPAAAARRVLPRLRPPPERAQVLAAFPAT